MNSSLRFARGCLCALIVLLALCPPAAGQPEARKVQFGVMTYNIRYLAMDKLKERDGRLHPWDGRKQMVIRVIRMKNPDLLGLQEAQPPQRQDLAEALAQYAAHRTIMWKKAKFEKRDGGTQGLPEVRKGHKRGMDWVRLRSKELGQDVFVFNTHFPPGLKEPQKLQLCSYVADFINWKAGPSAHALLTGDLNIHDTDSQGIKVIRNRARMADPWSDTGTSQVTVWNHWFDPVWAGPTVDWILYRRPFAAARMERPAYNESGLYPSDHLAVYALLNAGWAREEPEEEPMIEIAEDDDGNLEVLLENSVLRVRYALGRENQGYIREFHHKELGRSVAGHLCDASAHRGLMTGAELICDEPEVKTVRITWAKVPGGFGNEGAVSDVSIFAGGPFVRIVYRDFVFAHVAEHGGWQGTYAIHGYEDPGPPQYEKCFFWRDGRFGCSGENAPETGIAGDPGPLAYKDCLVMSVFREDGVGYGRAIEADKVHTVKLLFNSGFEIFMRDKPVTSYLFAITGGREEALSLGRKLANRIAAERAEQEAEDQDGGTADKRR